MPSQSRYTDEPLHSSTEMPGSAVYSIVSAVVVFFFAAIVFFFAAIVFYLSVLLLDVQEIGKTDL